MITLPGRISLVIQPSFWLLALLFGWLMGHTFAHFMLWVIVVFGSLLVHELGHAVMAKMWGQRARIEFNLLGGTTIRQGGALSKAREFVIVMMGPLFGFGLAFVAKFCASYVHMQGNFLYFLDITWFANIFWNILNLLPIHPLDGGRLVAIVCDALFGLRGVRFSYFLSTLFAVGAAAFFMASGAIIIGALFLICAFESYKSWQSARLLRTGGEDRILLEEISRAEFDWEHNQPERAIARLEELVRKQAKGEVFFRAIEKLIGYLLVSGKTEQAYALLFPVKDSLDGTLLKQFQLACYKQGFWQLALDAGIRAFREDQDISSAILSAFSSAQLGKVMETINWLRCVQKSKSIDMKSILSAEDLDEIRQNPHFIHFASTV